MAIPTSRTKEKAQISINKDICKGCGLCVTCVKRLVWSFDNQSL